MEYWGIELKTGEPHCFRLQSDEHRKLHVTKATVGEGLGKEKSVVQYLVGGSKSRVDFCEFSPNENESCSLCLELECDVEFSVIGDRCIHLTGYLETHVQDKVQTHVQDKVQTYVQDQVQTHVQDKVQTYVQDKGKDRVVTEERKGAKAIKGAKACVQEKGKDRVVTKERKGVKPYGIGSILRSKDPFLMALALKLSHMPAKPGMVYDY